jgi:hypothetical protein
MREHVGHKIKEQRTRWAYGIQELPCSRDLKSLFPTLGTNSGVIMDKHTIIQLTQPECRRKYYYHF